jgi:glycosyltransferase involved in cell wall biosynthesis/putative flippase GtrA
MRSRWAPARLARFAVVGAGATAIDLGTFLALTQSPRAPLWVADLIALVLAASASYVLNRRITFAGDWHMRWVYEPAAFVAMALAAGAVDLGAVVVLAGVVGGGSTGALAGIKALGMAAAAVLRSTVYRRRLLRTVREHQMPIAGRRPPPGEFRFTVVVPTFRERERIGSTLAALRQALAPLALEGAPPGGDGSAGERRPGRAGAVEIVVADDGSDDGTVDAARAAGADQVVALPVNRGKGAAVRAGVLAARGRTIAFTDADLAYPPAQLLHLLAEVEAGADMVVGSRRHVETKTLVRARRLRELTGRLFNLLTELILLGRYRDTQCGLKAFRSDVARVLFSRTTIDRFAFDVELFHLAERFRLSLVEVPVELANTTQSTVRVATDALRMVRDLIVLRVRVGGRSYDLDAEDARSFVAGGRPGVREARQ